MLNFWIFTRNVKHISSLKIPGLRESFPVFEDIGKMFCVWVNVSSSEEAFVARLLIPCLATRGSSAEINALDLFSDPIREPYRSLAAPYLLPGNSPWLGLGVDIRVRLGRAKNSPVQVDEAFHCVWFNVT